LVLYDVASRKDLTPNKLLAFNAGGKSILITDIDGKYYAIGNKCTHRGCTLSDGELKGDIVECPCHFSNFDVKTGRVVQGPATIAEPSFELRVEGDKISVNI
jgi:nitrite reductase/ring-hydroxylating ferredoxin subunit